MRAALLVLLLLAAYALAGAIEAVGEGAQCATDTECMELCMPDQVNCDGGPES